MQYIAINLFSSIKAVGYEFICTKIDQINALFIAGSKIYYFFKVFDRWQDASVYIVAFS